MRSVSEFNVGDLKQRGGDGVPEDMSVYQLLLQTVTNERDELKQSLERVNAHWEGRVKRLETQLEAHRGAETIADTQVLYIIYPESLQLFSSITRTVESVTIHVQSTPDTTKW